jgi:shikimate dehydrogenase
MPDSIDQDNIDRYAVFGNPVKHSKSPQIHKLFAEQTNQSLSYTAELVKAELFNNAVRAFASNNGKGLNITVPFKQEAWKLATKCSDRAQRAGAVNTLVIDGNNYFGDNTDGIGLVRDLSKNHNINLNKQHILIVGAGGAVRGIIEPVMEQNPEEIVITNRTAEKAEKLAEDFSKMDTFAGTITAYGLNDPTLAKKNFNIVINGTSASLHNELPVLPETIFSENACAYDLLYSAKPTPFMQWASEHGVCYVFDGLGMLVEQAAESFKLWRGMRPETKKVIEVIRASLG